MEIYSKRDVEKRVFFDTQPYKTDFIHIKDKKRNIIKDYIYMNDKKVLI